VPKRNRVRARARRPIDAASQQRAERAERDRPERVRPRYRGAPLPPGGAQAVGAPSPALQRAATLERTNVITDLRRLGIVVGATLALLFVSGLVLSALVR